MKVGVIGTGAMGRHHARVYASLPDVCRLAGVFDLDYGRASAVAEEFGCAAFRSLRDLLGEADAVSVAVPTSAHYRVGMECIRRNVHVLMEKPIAETERQARTLIAQANARGVVLQAGHIELFNPVVQVLKGLLAGEEIVSLEISRLRPQIARNSGADVISDSMIHDVYIASYLLGSEVGRVYALGKQEDGLTRHAAALLYFRSGAVVQLTASYLSERKVRSIRIITKRAVIAADLLNREIRRSSLPEGGPSEPIPVPDGEPLRGELLSFIAAANANRGAGSPAVTGEDGLAALSLVNRMIRMISAS